MVKKKKHDKNDKYYRLAKAQGYRSRAAFKLTQLNKQYDYLNDFIKIEDTGEYVQIARMPSIDALIDGQVAGLEWLDSIDHLLERYPDESRTQAFSGIKIPMN